jgi:hypothetical protein
LRVEWVKNFVRVQHKYPEDAEGLAGLMHVQRYCIESAIRRN